MGRVESVRRLAGEFGYRFGGWPRRLLAAGCLILAALAAAAEHRARAAAAQKPVLVAARDLAAGSPLRATDVRRTLWPGTVAPAAVLHESREVVGAILAAAMTNGEPFTTARLRGRGLAAGLPAGQVAVTVALADAAGAQVIEAGDVVDLLVASSPSADSPTADPAAPALARVLASRILVLAVLASSSVVGRADISGGASLVVAIDVAGSRRIAGAIGAPIVATLRAPP